MEYLHLFFTAFVDLSNAMAPYILFGLLFAGILHELVPESLVSKHLGKSSIGSVIKATLFGVPLPVCSCGVIPLATSIKKSGASDGATLSFLISTPITGIDSILATYGMFGWAFTIYRVVTSMIISMIAGILANFTEKEKVESSLTNKLHMPVTSNDADPSSCDSSCACESSAPQFSAAASFSISPLKEESCCATASCCSGEPSKAFSIQKALKYAFVTLLGDIASPLFFGLLLGALITVAVPSNLSEILLKYSWISYIIVISIAVPMYVCATASLPIAAGLMLAGVSPGAAFVFLSAGPATNTVTIGVVKKMLGSRTLYIYLGTIIISSIVFGFGLDYILQDISVKDMIHLHEEAGFVEWTSTTLLWSMVLYFIIKPYFKKQEAKCCSN